MSSLRAPRVLLRASILSTLQYRGDFVFLAIRSLFEVGWTLLPLLIVFGQRPTIAGWHIDEALLVTAWFTGEKALLEGLISPSLVRTVEQIRLGTFDFVLLKPVDPQILASFGKAEIFSAVDALAACGMLGVALHRLRYTPTLGQAALAAILTVCAAVTLYSLNIAAISIAFHVARIDNLVYLLGALFDAARWPSTIFRGAMRLVFTFVLPLGVMTTFPPLALLGRLSIEAVLLAALVAIVSLVISRALWSAGLRSYRSAGG